MKINGVTFNTEEPEIIEVLDVLDEHDCSVAVAGYSDDGTEYSAIGFVSCGELVDIEEHTIELIAKGE
jgi:hypothetical protein